MPPATLQLVSNGPGFQPTGRRTTVTATNDTNRAMVAKPKNFKNFSSPWTEGGKVPSLLSALNIAPKWIAALPEIVE